MSKRKCSACGSNIDDNSMFCPKCRAPAPAIEVAVRKDRPVSGFGKTALRDTIILVGLVLVVGVWYFVQRDRPADAVATGHGELTGEAAMTMPNELLNRLPDNYDMLVAMGNQNMDEGNYVYAAEIYRRALNIDGSSPDVRTDYGACLHAMGLAERAVSEFMTVITEYPEHSIARFNLGIVYSGLGLTDSARVYWEAYLTLDPDGKAAAAAREYLQHLDEH